MEKELRRPSESLEDRCVETSKATAPGGLVDRSTSSRAESFEEVTGLGFRESDGLWEDVCDEIDGFSLVFARSSPVFPMKSTVFGPFEP